MKQLNPAHIEAAMDLLNRAPFLNLLDMKVTHLDVGYARAEMLVSRKHTNAFGGIHGGAYASAIDTAAYLAAYCELPEEAGFTSIDLKVDNLAMISEGKMIIEGKSLKVGRSLCLTEATATNDEGKLLAFGTSKIMVLQGKQSVADAVKAMGYGNLPPKYLD